LFFRVVLFTLKTGEREKKEEEKEEEEGWPIRSETAPTTN
jgi:hypothetical protein